MAEVVLDSVGKVYVDGTRAVQDLSLDIADGEFLVLVGPSGCGKTTALRMVAGLEEISEGEIRIGDTVVNRVPSRDRDVAMVFQSYALYPHLSVRENIAFGLRLRKVARHEIDRRVDGAATTLGLRDYLERKPRNLSGGQRQRVAMGRAIVREPRAFLMDEPLSNLDAKLRVNMRAEIARLQRGLGVTTIYVTHDQTEAMTLGHRVAVLREGVLQQVAAPQDLYDRPANVFVAGFIGSPAMNLVRGTLTGGPDALELALGSQVLRLGPATLANRPALRAYAGPRRGTGVHDAALPGPCPPSNAGRPVVVGIRPEDMEDAALTRTSLDATLRSTVELVEAMGSDILVHFGLDVAAVDTDDTLELARDGGALSPERRAGAHRTVLVGRFSPRSRVREGQPLTVHVDTDRLHFFDPETGQSLGDHNR